MQQRLLELLLERTVRGANRVDFPIDTLHEIGACPTLQIAVGAGVFNRAEGLAEEIGADLWASNPLELAERLVDEPRRRADFSQRTVGRTRVRRAA
jgi:hypothetical protein